MTHSQYAACSKLALRGILEEGVQRKLTACSAPCALSANKHSGTPHFMPPYNAAMNIRQILNTPLMSTTSRAAMHVEKQQCKSSLHKPHGLCCVSFAADSAGGARQACSLSSISPSTASNECHASLSAQGAWPTHGMLRAADFARSCICLCYRVCTLAACCAPRALESDTHCKALLPTNLDAMRKPCCARNAGKRSSRLSSSVENALCAVQVSDCALDAARALDTCFAHSADLCCQPAACSPPPDSRSIQHSAAHLLQYMSCCKVLNSTGR
jgi:hypothetical protein